MFISCWSKFSKIVETIKMFLFALVINYLSSVERWLNFQNVSVVQASTWWIDELYFSSSFKHCEMFVFFFVAYHLSSVFSFRFYKRISSIFQKFKSYHCVFRSNSVSFFKLKLFGKCSKVLYFVSLQIIYNLSSHVTS